MGRTTGRRTGYAAAACRARLLHRRLRLLRGWMRTPASSAITEIPANPADTPSTTASIGGAKSS